MYPSSKELKVPCTVTPHFNTQNNPVKYLKLRGMGLPANLMAEYGFESRSPQISSNTLSTISHSTTLFLVLGTSSYP